MIRISKEEQRVWWGKLFLGNSRQYMSLLRLPPSTRLIGGWRSNASYISFTHFLGRNFSRRSNPNTSIMEMLMQIKWTINADKKTHRRGIINSILGFPGVTHFENIVLRTSCVFCTLKSEHENMLSTDCII